MNYTPNNENGGEGSQLQVPQTNYEYLPDIIPWQEDEPGGPPDPLEEQLLDVKHQYVQVVVPEPARQPWMDVEVSQSAGLMERYSSEQASLPDRYAREDMFQAQRAKMYARRPFACTKESETDPKDLKGRQSAMEVVGRIPELVEQVLRHVDLQTLLVSCTRVSTTWHVIIHRSRILQERLFFRPVEGDARHQSFGWCPYDDEDEYRRPQFNPLLTEKFGTCFFDFGGPLYGKLHRRQSLLTMPWTSKAHGIAEVNGVYTGPRKYKVKEPGSWAEEDKRQAAEERERFTRRGASWRRMLVSQPPPPSLGLVIYRRELIGLQPRVPWEGDPYMEQDEHISVGRHSATQRPGIGGVRMGELYDAATVLSCGSGKSARFWRVLWGRPERPFKTRALNEARREILSETTFVLEMHDENEGIDYGHFREQDRMTDEEYKTFICEDVMEERVLVETKRVRGRDHPEMDHGLEPVWHFSVLPTTTSDSFPATVHPDSPEHKFWVRFGWTRDE